MGRSQVTDIQLQFHTYLYTFIVHAAHSFLGRFASRDAKWNNDGEDDDDTMKNKYKYLP